jgi:hypothetical protein
MTRNPAGYIHPVAAPRSSEVDGWVSDPLGRLVGMAPSDTYVPLHELPNWHDLTKNDKESLRILPLCSSYTEVSEAIGQRPNWLSDRKAKSRRYSEALEVRERVTSLDVRRYFMDEVTAQGFMEVHRILNYGKSGDAVKLKAAQYLVDRDDRMRKSAALVKYSDSEEDTTHIGISDMLSFRGNNAQG